MILEHSLGKAFSFSQSPQFSSVTQSRPTLCDPMNCSTSGFPVHHQPSDLTQTHVHQVSDAIHPGCGAGPRASRKGWLVKFSVYLQACYLLYFPEGEIKVSKVYWFAYSDSVSRQGIGSETNFLASFPKHANSLPCSASTGSQESISENLIRKHMKGDSETTEALRKS